MGQFSTNFKSIMDFIVLIINIIWWL